MNKTTKLVIGFLTMIPLVYLVFYISIFFSDSFFRKENFELIFKLHLGVMVLIIGLLIFYITNVFKTERIPNDKKALWAVVFFFGHMVAMIVYWYLYIWTEPKENKNEL